MASEANKCLALMTYETWLLRGATAETMPPLELRRWCNRQLKRQLFPVDDARRSWWREEWLSWPWSTRLLMPLWLGAIPVLIVLVLMGQANSALANVALGVLGFGFALNLFLAGVLEV